VFALGGGGSGVSYPAATLYADALATPEALHDVTVGSNGACSKGFTEKGQSKCTAKEEATSCAGELICLAAKGYDGPTGVGTPDGVTDFQPATPGGKEEAPHSEGPGGGSGGSPPGGGSSPPPGGGSPPGAGQASVGVPPGLEEGEGEAGEEGQPAAAGGAISGLSFTAATVAAATRHHLDQLAFSFTASATVHVRVTLSRRVTSHRRVRWHALHRSATISAKPGRNSGRLATGPLAPGTYRLTLTAAHGITRSLVIHVRS